MKFSTLCTILVTFGSETPEFTLLTIAPFVAIWQKSACHAKYLRMSWTYLNLLYRFGMCISGDDFPNIRLAVACETLLWQPVKYGRKTDRDCIPYIWQTYSLIFTALLMDVLDCMGVNPLVSTVQGVGVCGYRNFSTRPNPWLNNFLPVPDPWPLNLPDLRPGCGYIPIPVDILMTDHIVCLLNYSFFIYEDVLQFAAHWCLFLVACKLTYFLCFSYKIL